MKAETITLGSVDISFSLLRDRHFGSAGHLWTKDKCQQSLVQQSWQRLTPLASQAAELFYRHLFAADPSLKALFRGDMREQGHKLMQIIGAAVGKLDDTATLLPMVAALGRRHAGYGVQPAHYQTVGAALLITLGQGLGDAFTPAVKEAWTEVYDMLAEVMIGAAVIGPLQVSVT